MMKTTLKIASLGVVLVSLSSIAADLPCNVHTQMNLSSKAGTWNTQVQHLNEIGNIVILDQGCKPINTIAPGTDASQHIQQVTSVSVAPDSMLTVGHQLGETENFDTSLLFSMVQVPEEGVSHDSPTKTCMFYVAAKGPADPVTRIYELNGAQCTFVNDIDHMTYNFSAK